VANKVSKFIPNHASIYFNVANILRKKGNIKKQKSKDPTTPMIYANLGISRKHGREGIVYAKWTILFIDIREYISLR